VAEGPTWQGAQLRPTQTYLQYGEEVEGSTTQQGRIIATLQ